MQSYRLSERVLRDLEGIWSFIAEKNEAAADNFIDRMIGTFELLGKNPYAGRSREDLRSGYRSFPVGSYVVFYRVIDARIQIEHVLHGARDIPRYLS